MDEQDLKARTKHFALRVINLVDALPGNTKGRAIASQLMRSGSSVAANYRAVCRAKSTADFLPKLSIVEDEADETAFWVELITEAGIMPESKTRELLKEANELVAIMVSSRMTAARKSQHSKIKNHRSKIP